LPWRRFSVYKRINVTIDIVPANGRLTTKLSAER
jgi:hypothetical protein